MVTTAAPIFIFAAYFAFILMKPFAERAKNGQRPFAPSARYWPGAVRVWGE
jgi:hypothetical protein